MTPLKFAGLAQFDASLAEMPIGTRGNILKRTVLAALEPMAATARQLAPDDPTTPDPDLASSIVASTKRSSGLAPIHIDGLKPGAVMGYVGPTKEGYPQAMMQEFGSVPHEIKPKKGEGDLAFEAGGDLVVTGAVHHPGNPPHPYMRPAYDQHKESALGIVGTRLGDEIEKSRVRAARKAERAALKAAGR